MAWPAPKGSLVKFGDPRLPGSPTTSFGHVQSTASTPNQPAPGLDCCRGCCLRRWPAASVDGCQKTWGESQATFFLLLVVVSSCLCSFLSSGFPDQPQVTTNKKQRTWRIPSKKHPLDWAGTSDPPLKCNVSWVNWKQDIVMETLLVGRMEIPTKKLESEN